MKKLFFAFIIALTASTAVQAQSKIAHVNSQKLLDTIPSRKKAAEELGFLNQKGVEELTEMESALQKAYAEYGKLPATTSQAIREYEQGRIEKMQQAMQTRQMEIEQKLRLMADEVTQQSEASVREAVDIVAKRKGLNYVVDERTTLFLGGTDITSEVVIELLKIDAKKSAATPGTVTNTPTPPGGQ